MKEAVFKKIVAMIQAFSIGYCRLLAVVYTRACLAIMRKEGGTKTPVKSASIRSRFGCKAIAAKVVNQRFKEHLDREITIAVQKTLKRKKFW